MEIMNLMIDGKTCHMTLRSGENMVRKELSTELAEELGLVRGLILSKEELQEIMNGKIPDDWDSLENRHDYQTDLGTVCMAGAEYREFMERKEENTARDQ